MITTITSCLVYNHELALTIADRLIGSDFRNRLDLPGPCTLNVTIEQKFVLDIGPNNGQREVTSFIISVEHDPKDTTSINNFIRDIVRKYWTEHGYPY